MPISIPEPVPEIVNEPVPVPVKVRPVVVNTCCNTCGDPCNLRKKRDVSGINLNNTAVGEDPVCNNKPLRRIMEKVEIFPNPDNLHFFRFTTP